MTLATLHARSFSRLFQGRRFAEVQHHVDQFLNEKLESLLNPVVFNRLQEAQAQGKKIVLLSSSPDFLVEQIAKRLKIDEWKATPYHVDATGLFSGIGAIMDGEAKAYYVQKLVYQSLTIYSDSALDLPLLKMANQAIAVSPDARLKREALCNGWEIL